MAKPSGKLTALQRRFCREYLVDGNGAAAYRRAGGAPTNANDLANRLRQLPYVAAEIARLQDEQFKRLEMRADEVVAFVSEVIRADLTTTLNADGTTKPHPEWPANVRQSLTQFEVEEIAGGEKELDDGSVVTKPAVSISKVKLSDKMAAARLLFSKHGLLKDKLEVSGGFTLEQLVPKRKAPTP